MLLEIRDIKQNSMKICVKRSDTIINIKDKIKVKIPMLDIDDQKLVYSGNILDNDRTVEDCEIAKNDYVTLIYNSMKKNEVREMIEKVTNEIKTEEESKNSDQMYEDVSAFSLSDDGSKSIKTESRNTSEEFDTNADQIMNTDDSDSDLSHNTLLESIPDVKKMCKIIVNNPVNLSKFLSKLSRQGSFVFEKILQNQQAYIDLLNAEEYSTTNNAIEKLETKDHGAIIDRLMKKGYEKEMVLQVYRECDFDEVGAAELLKCLH